MSQSPLNDEEQKLRFQQRLWGVAAVAALAVIVLPLLLDGSGSESQFRRVEQLREQPGELRSDDRPSPAASTEQDIRIRVGEEDPPDYLPRESEDDASRGPLVGQDMDRSLVGAPVEALTAWVVQVGSFNDEDNALVVRDELRAAGYPSFVSASEDGGTGLYRVRIGPMIDEADARRTEQAVGRLLGRDAITVRYP